MAYQVCPEYAGNITQVHFAERRILGDWLISKMPFLEKVLWNPNGVTHGMAAYFSSAETHRFPVSTNNVYLCDYGIFVGYIDGRPLVFLTDDTLLPINHPEIEVLNSFESHLRSCGVEVDRVPFWTIGGDALITERHAFIGTDIMQSTAALYGDYADARFGIARPFSPLGLETVILDPAGELQPSDPLHYANRGFYHLDTALGFIQGLDDRPVALLAQLNGDPNGYHSYLDHVESSLSGRGYGIERVPAIITDNSYWTGTNLRVNGHTRTAYAFSSGNEDVDNSLRDTMFDYYYRVIFHKPFQAARETRAGFRCFSFTIRSLA
ncbi:MAG: hypothetical protein ABH879_09420 [archaeon]